MGRYGHRSRRTITLRVRNNRTTSRDYQEIHTDRLAPEFKRGSEYKEEINFRQCYVVLPLTWSSGRLPELHEA
jgi:hypothetical protein